MNLGKPAIEMHLAHVEWGRRPGALQEGGRPLSPFLPGPPAGQGASRPHDAHPGLSRAQFRLELGTTQGKEAQTGEAAQVEIASGWRPTEGPSAAPVWELNGLSFRQVPH